MHFQYLILLPALASAGLIRRSEPWTKWCNEDDPTKNCISEKINLSQCKAIPDSNAKGNKGSNVYVCQESIRLS